MTSDRKRRQPRQFVSGVAIAVLAAGASLTPLFFDAESASAQECTAGFVNPMGGATPIGSEAGYTVYTPGDGVFGNSELEGTIAVGGTGAFGAAGGSSGSYAIFQGGVGGNADYAVPTIDGDINRVLLGRFGLPTPDAPQRVAQVQVRVDGTPAAGVKIVDQDTPTDYTVMAAYDSAGSTFSLAPAAGGTNMSPQISSTPQLWDGGSGASSWVTAQSAFTDYFPADTGTSILANATYVAPAAISLGGEASVTIDPSAPNEMTLAEFGSAAKFTVTQYSPQSPLVVHTTDADVVDGVLQLPSYAYPGKDIPNGEGISYVLFDLSTLSGDVLVTSRGGEPVRGSLYAPGAHIIFPPEAQGGVEFEGQVIAGDFTALQGGKEIHTNLFAGQFTCGDDEPVGGFTLQKVFLGGISPADIPTGTTFQVTASWTIEGTDFSEEYDVPADGTIVTGAQGLPVGTVVDFSEATPPDIDGWGFDNAEFTPESITIDDSETTLVTVSNTYSPVGGFSLQKEVAGVPDEDVPPGTTFRVLAVWADDGVPHLEWFDLPADGTTLQGPQNIAAGTTVTFLEPQRVTVDGYVFQGVTFSARQVTISQGDNINVTATNTYAPTVPDAGGFSLHKQIDGADVSDFPDGTTFEVTASWVADGTSTTQVFDLPVDGTEVLGPQDLPVGTTVTFVETDPTPLTPAGFTLDDWGVSPESIVIGEGDNTQVVAMNQYSADAPVGGFSLSKTLVGIDSSDFPAGSTFPVVALRFDDGRPVIQHYDLPADGTVVAGPANLPVGSRVAFIELDGPDVPAGFEFEETSFAADGTALSPRVITIGDGTDTTVTAINTYQAIGGFSLRKELVGIDSGVVPPGTTFTAVAWTRIDGVFAWRAFQLPADGTLVQGPQDLPVGAVVRFFEVEPAIVDGYAFTASTFSPTSIEIGEGEDVTVTATNTYRALLGGFSVTKVIEGSGADSVPSTTSFDIEYFVNGASTAAGTISLPATGEQVDGPQDLPQGTVVTFQELAPPAIPGTEWGTPTFSPEQVVISDGENVNVIVENSIRDLVGGFSIHKTMTGTGAALIPPTTTFDVDYYLDGSRDTAGTLTLRASGEVVQGPSNLPVGTVVTFQESSPLPTVAGGTWGTPSFDPVRVVIRADDTVDVVLSNSFSADRPAANSNTGSLPDTGMWWTRAGVVLGATLLLLGACVLLIVRRRKAEAT